MTESTDIALYLDRLRALPFVEGASVRAPDRRTPNGLILTITAHRKKHTFDIGLLRTHLSQAEVERWVGRAKRPDQRHPLVLLAPYVSRPMGERLREAGVQYVDQAGNMHLDLKPDRKGSHALTALIEGKRPAPVSRGDTAWRAPSYQVLLALLVQPELLSAPVRTIAAHAGVSTSPVLQVQKKLLQAGFAVTRRSEWQWTPHRREQARAFWLHGYHATLRPHLLLGRFRPRTPLSPEALERAVEESLRGRHPLRWGGAAAAHRLDPYYRGDRTVLHLEDEATPASLAMLLRMLPDPEGQLIVLRVPGPAALHSPDPVTVHPLLVWAELLEEGHDRASEAADRLASTFLNDVEARASVRERNDQDAD